MQYIWIPSTLFLLVWIIASIMNTKYFYVGLVIAITAFGLFWFLWFRPKAKEHASRALERAEELEREMKFKDSCLQYAIAILNGTDREFDCRQKIKELWEKYGPFDYEDKLAEHQTQKDASGIAGIRATISIIKESLNSGSGQVD